MVAGLMGGLLGGAAGILIWVVVGYTTHHEVGWIAWGVGFLTGFGVRYASYLRSGEEASLPKGIVAAAMAVGSIVAAKYIVFLLIVGGAKHVESGKWSPEDLLADESMVSGLADKLVADMAKNGQPIAWPPGMSAETAARKNDYPPAIWQQAETQWNALGVQGQADRRKALLQLAMALEAATRKPGFDDTFTPYDFLWVALAVITAFKIGVGTYGNE